MRFYFILKTNAIVKIKNYLMAKIKTSNSWKGTIYYSSKITFNIIVKENNNNIIKEKIIICYNY